MSDASAGPDDGLTQQVAALHAALDDCLARGQRYRTLFDATGAAYGLAELIVDGDGRPADYRLLEVNGAYGQLVGLPPDAIEGKTIRELMPGFEQRWIETYGNVALTGEPVRLEKSIPSFDNRRFEVFVYRPAPGQFMHVLFDVTTRKQAEQQQEDQLRFFQTLLDTIPVPVFYKNTAGIYLGCNLAFAEYLGIARDRIVGRTAYDVAPRHLADIYWSADRELLARGGVQTYETHVRHADGTERDVVFRKAVFTHGEGETAGLVGAIFDLTERKRAEQALRESQERYRQQAGELEAIYQSMPVGIAVLDRDLRYLRINARLARLYGRSVEDHLNKSVREVVPWLADTAEALVRQIFESGHAVRRYEVRSPPGENGNGERIYLSHWVPLKDESGSVWGVNMVLEETTERRRLEERTRHMAQHDALTNLPNRRLMLSLLDASLRTASRKRHRVAVLFLDLDRFKIINDTLGHDMGDALLKAVAHRLSGRMRRSDMVARLGGDEFTVLLPEVVHGEQAGEVAESVLQAFRRPFHLMSHTLHVTTSIGISLYPDDSDTAEGLLRCADAAMYEAKQQGADCFRFYNPAIGRRARERLRVEDRLREAVTRGGLLVHYQPQFDLSNERVVGVEALVRWQHPELGLLTPPQFLPISEETDLIQRVDDWVLRTACFQGRRWLDAGLPPVIIGVNVSARRFQQPDLLDAVRRVLADSGLPPAGLELELNERTLMLQLEHSVQRLRELADMGVGVAIHNFGTGCSSLGHLKRLPIRRLKIDRSFLQDITDNRDDRAIFTAITALAHTLEQRVVAEGVETGEQKDFLYEADCDQAQGFIFTEPLPAEGVEDLLRRQ
ncbi:MAG: EAL domain-containing protein [Thiohalomonadaceae bacterium]